MYEIILINPEFGTVLNENGDIHIKGTEEFRPKFSDMEAAIAEKDRLLNKYIYAGVIIRDLNSGDASQEFYNEELGPK
ncbi:MAG: hypothetical protein R2747_15830 [Pyrinomonadaceae bacterium]